MTDREPISIEVSPDTNVFHAMKAALSVENLDGIALGLVTVKFNDVKVNRGANISHYNTSADSPLLIELLEQEGEETIA